jgi:hypothetical protein
MAMKTDASRWAWDCPWCNAVGSSRTPTQAEESLRAHRILHIKEVVKELMADGLVEPVGQRNGSTIYRATEFGKECASLAVLNAPSEQRGPGTEDR